MGNTGRDALRAARLEKAKHYIDRHLADAHLTPATVAAALRISRRQIAGSGRERRLR